MQRFLSSILLIWLTACSIDPLASATPSFEPTPLSSQTFIPMDPPLSSGTHPPESAATTPPTNNLRDPSPTPALINIASADIQTAWWSQDASTLFYGVPNKNMAYHIEQGVTQELSPEELYEQTPQPQILSQLPPDARRIYVSPSRKNALYFKIIRPSLTPTPSETAELGEYTTRGTIAELWFHREDGYTSKMGELEFCGFTDAFWTNDERKVIIPRGASISRCGKTYAWLVDITHQTLHPLFPLEEYSLAVRTYDLSPDGKSLLFGTFGVHKGDRLTNPLYLLHLDSFAVEQLETPDLAHGEQWLTDSKLLISYEKQPQIDLTLGLYDLDTTDLVELTPMFNGLCIRFASVSPDLEWLAFATGQACDSMEDLWLMRFYLNK